MSARPAVAPLPRPAAPDRRVAVVLGAVGVVAAVALAGSVTGLGLSVFLVAVGVGLVASGRVRRPAAVGLAAVVTLAAIVPTVRADPLLGLVAVALLAAGWWLAAAHARGGSLLAIGPRTAGDAVLWSVVAAGRLPGFVGRAVSAAAPVTGPDGRRRAGAVGRGLLLAVPVVLAVGALLASGDAVVATVLRVPDVDGLVTRLVCAGCGIAVVGTLVVEASTDPRPPGPGMGRPLGRTEAIVVLAGLVTVLGVFALSQVVAAAGGADRVLATAGLTYADYARQGFFQLLAAAGVTLVVLWLIRLLVAPGEGIGLVVLGELAVALTLVVVGVAWWRLHLYDDAYGLTMLRYAAVVGAWFLAALLVAAGGAFAGVGRGRPWLGGATAALALVAFAAVAVTNPAATVARHNLARAEAGAPLDVSYLVGLGDDAVPTIVDGLAALDPVVRDQVVDALCRPPRRARSAPVADPSGWAWNRAVADATARRAEVCGR